MQMRKATRLRSATRALATALLWLGACAGEVEAQTTAASISEATANSVLSPAAAVPPTPPASAAGASWLRPRGGKWTGLRVVELPIEPHVGGRSRKHHALSWRNDTLSRSLGNAGWAGADCQNRVRLPSRWRSASPQGTQGPEVQLQVAVGCSF
jgi:hypothetical protein